LKGAISKKLVVPEPKMIVGSKDVLSLITIYGDVVKQLFEVIFNFIRSYTNNSYCVGLYLNMNRIIKAEIDMNEAIKGLKGALRLVSFLKFQNLGTVAYVGVWWTRKARNNLSYKHKREEMLRGISKQ
jgi:hypothetical protein